MGGNVKTQIGKIIGKTLNSYYPRVKPTIDNLKYKQEYQDRIIECMVSEVDDNYITTPETDNPIVKLEHSKEGLVKVPTVKGKTILVDADGNETDTPAEGCKLLSVGEQEDNKLIILSNNKNLFDGKKFLGNYITHTTHGIEMSYEDGGIRFKGTTNGGGSPTTRMISITKLLKEGYTYKVKSNSNIIHASFRCYLKDTNESQYTTVLNNYDSSLYNDVCVYLQYGNWQQSVVINELCKIHISVWDNVYIDHKSHKTEILLDEPLRSLPNGVCDEIVGNKLIRRVGVRPKAAVVDVGIIDIHAAN